MSGQSFSNRIGIAMKVILYIATSLDGFIARPDGDVDWLSMVDQPGEDYGYYQFYESVDALVMGRKTYEIPAGVEEWPYPGKQSFVFTHRDIKTSRDDVTFVSDPVEQVMEQMCDQGFQNVWLVGGGELIRSFLAHNLIDEHIISVIPILLGEGIPLFPPPCPEQKLELVGSSQYKSGLIEAHYRHITAE